MEMKKMQQGTNEKDSRNNSEIFYRGKIPRLIGFIELIKMYSRRY